jgi:hypothetical protein
MCYGIYHSISSFEFQQPSLKPSIMYILNYVGSKLTELTIEAIPKQYIYTFMMVRFPIVSHLEANLMYLLQPYSTVHYTIYDL